MTDTKLRDGSQFIVRVDARLGYWRRRGYGHCAEAVDAYRYTRGTKAGDEAESSARADGCTVIDVPVAALDAAPEVDCICHETVVGKPVCPAHPPTRRSPEEIAREVFLEVASVLVEPDNYPRYLAKVAAGKVGLVEQMMRFAADDKRARAAIASIADRIRADRGE